MTEHTFPILIRLLNQWPQPLSNLPQPDNFFRIWKLHLFCLTLQDGGILESTFSSATKKPKCCLSLYLCTIKKPNSTNIDKVSSKLSSQVLGIKLNYNQTQPSNNPRSRKSFYEDQCCNTQ